MMTMMSDDDEYVSSIKTMPRLILYLNIDQLIHEQVHLKKGYS